MNFPRRFFFFLFIFAVPSTVFAQFLMDVEHSIIFKIAIERNVVTFFKRSTESLGIHHRRLGSQTGYIVFEHNDHALINHHGLGVDGDYVTHQHVAYVELSVVPPELLNRLLQEAGFSDDERVRIMQQYAQHFATLPMQARNERPLRPGQTNLQQQQNPAEPQQLQAPNEPKPTIEGYVEPTTPLSTLPGLVTLNVSVREMLLALFLMYLAVTDPNASRI